MIRFILAYKDENIFKDGKSFKSKKYAEKKAESFHDWERISNTRIDVEVKEIEVETSEEKLQKEIQSLKALIVESRSWTSIQFENHGYPDMGDWHEKTKDIKVDE